MKTGLIALLALFIWMSPGPVKAQQSEPQEVFVQSWQRGTKTVPYQVLRISLGRRQSEYTTEIINSSGNRYRLSIIHNPLSNVKNEHWKIEFNEIESTSDGKEILGENLLVVEGPGTGGDNFPRGDYVGYLYPEKDSRVVQVAGNYWTDGYPFYPIKTTRKIRVEGFYVVIKVENLKFSSTDKNKVDSLDLTIQYRSAVE